METLRKLVSVVGILLIIGAAYLNLLGIFEANTTKDKDTILTYIISANIVNGLAVLALIVLTINSARFSSFYKLFVILILLVGLVVELYLVGTELYTRNYGTYVALILNLLIRVYYLVYYFNNSWAMFPVATTQIIERTIVQPQKTIQQVPTIIEKVQDDDADKFVDQWKTLFRQAREKVGRDNFDEVSRERGYKEVILPALSTRDFSKDRLKDASGYLKDKAGNVIKDLVFGGKRRR